MTGFNKVAIVKLLEDYNKRRYAFATIGKYFKASQSNTNNSK